MAQPIGFIGLGNMGNPMAARLLAAGQQLLVYDRDPATVAKLVALGAKAAASVKALSNQVQTVLLSLPTPQIVEDVCLGATGLSGGGSIKTVIDLSTIGPSAAVVVARGLAQKKIQYVDAPVSGGIPGAVKGTLAVMVACPKRDFAAIEAIVVNFGKVFYLGDQPGQGQTMKLANNIMSITAVAITSEAIVMGVKAGLNPKTMLDVINVGSGRNTASADKFPRCVLPRTFDVGFAATLAQKDARLCVEEAEQMGVPMLVGAAAREVMNITLAMCGNQSDFSDVVRVYESWAGVEVREPVGSSKPGSAKPGTAKPGSAKPRSTKPTK